MVLQLVLRFCLNFRGEGCAEGELWASTSKFKPLPIHSPAIPTPTVASPGTAWQCLSSHYWMRTTCIFHRVHLSTFANKQAIHPVEEDSDLCFQPLVIKQLANQTTRTTHRAHIQNQTGPLQPSTWCYPEFSTACPWFPQGKHRN